MCGVIYVDYMYFDTENIVELQNLMEGSDD